MVAFSMLNYRTTTVKWNFTIDNPCNPFWDLLQINLLLTRCFGRQCCRHQCFHFCHTTYCRTRQCRTQCLKAEHVNGWKSLNFQSLPSVCFSVFFSSAIVGSSGVCSTIGWIGRLRLKVTASSTCPGCDWLVLAVCRVACDILSSSFSSGSNSVASRSKLKSEKNKKSTSLFQSQSSEARVTPMRYITEWTS